MASNPYAPPSAPISDVLPQAAPLERPAAVDRACTLLWCSTGLGVLGQVAQNFINFRQSSVIISVFGLGFGVLITFWFTSKLKRGRNWMRLFLTIGTALGFLFIPFMALIPRQMFMAMYGNQPALMAINIAVAISQFVLGLIIAVLINLRGVRGWFHAMRDRGHSAA
jgi:hypothetical protein